MRAEMDRKKKLAKKRKAEQERLRRLAEEAEQARIEGAICLLGFCFGECKQINDELCVCVCACVLLSAQRLSFSKNVQVIGHHGLCQP